MEPPQLLPEGTGSGGPRDQQGAGTAGPPPSMKASLWGLPGHCPVQQEGKRWVWEGPPQGGEGKGPGLQPAPAELSAPCTPHPNTLPKLWP